MFTSLGMFFSFTIVSMIVIGIPSFEFFRLPSYLLVVIFFGVFYINKLKLSPQNTLLIIFSILPLIQLLVVQGDMLATIQAIVMILSLYLFQNYIMRLQPDIHALNSLATYITIIMFAFHYNIVGWLERSAGIFGNPNTTAYMTVILLPLVLLFSNSKYMKLICIVNASILVVLAASRGSLMALILGTLGYLLIQKFKVKYITICFLSILFVLISQYAIDVVNYVVDYYLSNSLYHDLRDNTRLLRLDSNSREDIYRIAFERFFSSNTEFIGLGYDQAKFDLGDVRLGAHNSYVEILLRLGYIGLTLFIIYLFMLAKRISIIKNKKIKGLAFMEFTIILSLATNSSVFLVLNYYFFYLIVAIEIGIYLDNRKNIDKFSNCSRNDSLFST